MKKIHVIPNPNGGWNVVGEDRTTFYGFYHRKNEAEKRAYFISRKLDTNYVSHHRYGKA